MRNVILLFAVFWCQNLFGQLTVSDWLSKNNVKVSARLNQYNKEQYNLLVNQHKFGLAPGRQQQTFLKSKWEINSEAVFVKDKTDAVDYTVRFKCTDGNLDAASVSVDLDFDNWCEKNYVLFPSAVYNGNLYS